MEDAGFSNLKWGVWAVSEEGRKVFPEGFWDEFDEAKPCTILTAIKKQG